ncbi:MAG TPA: hypothetical protein VG271_14845, partial [Beijerinckiaceae bacterium]|nr:hypothetical protein [Beijerinckiaceae bacterium]
APMTIQTRRVGIDERWTSLAVAEDQIEPGMPEYIWSLNVEHDPVGATWGPGGLRAPTRTYWGWNAKAARKIKAPTLIMVGEQDRLMTSNRDLFEDLASETKVFLSIANATHFMAWEKQRHVLHRGSLAWLRETRLEGIDRGFLHADADGTIAKL